MNKLRYIPKNSLEILQDETNHVVYSYQKDGRACAIAYAGRRKKPEWNYRFGSNKERDEYINNYLNKRKEIKKEDDKRKANEKKRKDEEFKNIKVGDVFVSSWGYEQTNVDAYQLVELKGKTGTFKEIGFMSLKSTGPDAEYVRPIKDKFINKESFKKRLNGNSFKISSFQHAFKVKNLETSEFYNSCYY